MSDKQRFLIAKNIIIADYRENEVSEILSRFNLKVIKENLEVGDFIVSDDICIERKSYGDLISSIIDKRIFTQVELLKKNFKIPIIIIELFPKFERNVHENLIYSSLATLISKFNISILFSLNKYETAKIIYWLKINEDNENKSLSLLPHVKKPREIVQIKKLILSSFPGISDKLSEKLISEFKSLKKIFNSDLLKLSKVIGKKRSKKFIEILENEETSNNWN